MKKFELLVSSCVIISNHFLSLFEKKLVTFDVLESHLKTKVTFMIDNLPAIKSTIYHVEVNSIISKYEKIRMLYLETACNI